MGALAVGAFLASAAVAAPRSERPVPAFEGWTPGGERVSIADLLGRRFLLVVLDPEDPATPPLARAASQLAPERAEHNFGIVAVVTGAGTDATKGFVRESGLDDVTLLLDPQATFAGRLRLRGRTAAFVVDAEGYLVRGTEQLPGPAAEDLLEGELRSWLRLPDASAGAPELGVRPEAPGFTAGGLFDSESFELSSVAGEPVILIFFLHTCPHCHRALRSIRDAREALPEAARPRLVAVSVVNRPTEVRESLAAEGLDFFPVYVDASGSIARAYGARGAVPVVVLIDREGRIAWRFDGWRDDRDPPLLRMRTAILAGEAPPMLLHSTGYSGDEFCGTCHVREHETWLLTAHASAFETLVRHGADRDPECVGCHVVGFGEPGGYALAKPASHLEGVGCETCHARGGPHLSPGHAASGYEATCEGCHDAKHSLGFSYSHFLPKVSHAANAHLAGLSLDERRALRAEARRPRAALLPTEPDYVGSAACRDCHEAEHAAWSEHAHARAFATLETEGRADDAACRSCHTTAYDRGGFPAGGRPAAHADLVGVGCEACHGPGGDHVGPDAARRGTILSLADKCDSCVILQICGSCHDDANDPGFPFAVQEKIELQRHGSKAAPGAAPAGAEGRAGEGR